MGQQATAPPRGTPREDHNARSSTGGSRGSLQMNRHGNMSTVTSVDVDEDQDYYDEPYEPYRRAGGAHSRDHPSMHDFSTEDKSQELCGILKALEVQLENPTDFGVIGRTYRRLAEWTWEHQQDSDFPQVLELLAPEHMYPAWRRQALEEAYMLFFEDCAKQGNPRALDQLPEPPTSKEIGYRPLPEGLLDPKTTRGAAFTNTYEAGHACCIRRRWDYEVQRNGPRPKPGERKAAGRKIVAKDAQQRYCACAVDPMTKLMQYMLPDGMCCGRERKALPVDTRGMDDSHDSMKAPKPRTAALPASTAKFKSKPSDVGNGGFPAPYTPRTEEKEDNPLAVRGDQSLFAKDIAGRAPASSITV